MVISVGRTPMSAPAGSSECHLIKAMILFLPQQQHKCPHSRPSRHPSSWMVISDNNFLLFLAMEPEQGKAPAIDDYLAVPLKIIMQLRISLESTEFYWGQTNQWWWWEVQKKGQCELERMRPTDYVSVKSSGQAYSYERRRLLSFPLLVKKKKVNMPPTLVKKIFPGHFQWPRDYTYHVLSKSFCIHALNWKNTDLGEFLILLQDGYSHC